jgi:hypothetical protein
MDAVDVDPVVEVRSECADRAGAGAVLARMLDGVRAPRRAPGADAHWTVAAVVTTSAGARSATAEIRDGRGALVAERTVSDRSSASCLALVRAVGAWAQVVVDDELAREVDEGGRDERPAARAPEERRSAIVLSGEAPAFADEGACASARSRAAREGRAIDVGSTLFLRNGAAATGGMFGVAPYVAVALSDRWIVRPSALYGTSTARVPPDQSNSENVSSLGGRLDVCRRMPGNYIDQRGIELDACMGGDAARVWSSRESAWRGTVGPSAVLRGELGYDLALEVRSLLGVNLNRARFMGGDELSPVALGAEIGASVRFR